MSPATDNDKSPVAWDVAEQVARRLLRTAPIVDRETLQHLDNDFARATEQGEELVEQVTGLHSSAGPARSTVTDRAGWVEANVGSFQRLLSPLTARFNSESDAEAPRSSTAGRAVAGAEIGVVLAWMSKRVLGQYDVLPFEADSGGDIVYFVGPNIVGLERRHGFPPKEFRLWIAIHELTHRNQFTAVPWLREYFFGLIERATQLVTPDTKLAGDALSRVLADFKEGRNPLAQGGVVSILASKEQLAILQEAQAFMSLLEGHGNYVMGRAGADDIPGARRFAKVLADRRMNVKGIAKFIQQLFGLEAKLRQYAEGEQFVDAVAAAGGDELLAQVWSGPQMLPTLEEIRAPKRWITRVGGPAASIA